MLFATSDLRHPTKALLMQLVLLLLVGTGMAERNGSLPSFSCSLCK